MSLLRSPRLSSAVFCGVFLLCQIGSSQEARSVSDWPQWRGPWQNGTSLEPVRFEQWNPKGGPGSGVVWKNSDLGGISTPVVMNGKLYTLVRSEPETRREGEKVVCADALTGKILWENRFNVFLSDVPAERVGWSNCAADVATGRVYALGVCGLFQCLDGETGRTIWSRSLSEEFGLLTTYGGRTNTPVLFEDLVIIGGVTTGWRDNARPAHRVMAFDKTSGQLVWLQATRLFPEDTTYSTPVVCVLKGRAALVLGAGDGSVYALQPRTGTIIWKYDLSRRGLNLSPVIAGDRVYMGHSEENITGTTMGAMVAIDGGGQGDITKSGTLWKLDEVLIGKSGPVLLGDRLYAADDSGGLHVIDVQTGEKIGRTVKLGTAMRGSLVTSGGWIYACTASGIWYALEPTSDGVRTVKKLRLPSDEQVQGSPIIWNGHMYLTTTGGVYCIESQPAPAESGPAVVTSSATETPASGSPATQLLLVPAESIVSTSQSLQLGTRFFDSEGRPASPVPVQFTSTIGQVGEDGRFVTPDDHRHQVAVIHAQAGEMTARAVARICPSLPWSFEFADATLPATWVGADYRHVIRDVDGNPQLVKITTIPKGTRSQSWMGPTDLSNYTIEAQVKAGEQGKLPDIGVIAQRYTLDMQGESQQLQIRTWPPQLRMAVTVPFNWKANTWYTMKLQASLEGDKAVLRGKVWPRGEAEPAEWTIEATDETPNPSGSPGLFGNATNAEIHIDDIRVTPNAS